MSAKMVQINFRFAMPAAEYEGICNEVAAKLAKLPGLEWKAWLLNEQRREAGGIYLFQNDLSAQTYLEGPVISALRRMPGVENIEIKQFDVLAAPSAMTRFSTQPKA